MRPAAVRAGASALAAVGVVAFAATALPMAGDHPAGQPVRNDEWPRGIAELVNRPERVAGVWVNANDFFYFAGGTAEFNRFLEGYSRVTDTPLRVVLHSVLHSVLHDGAERPSWSWGDRPAVGYDWQLAVRRRGWGAEAPPDFDGLYVATIEVWVGKRIDVDRIRFFGPIAPLVGGPLRDRDR